MNTSSCFKRIVFTTLMLGMLKAGMAQPGSFRDSSVTAGFDTEQFHPFFIKSRDGQYTLHISAYAQLRYNAALLANTPDSVMKFDRGYNLGRARFFLEGNMTDKFYYHFRTNINPSGRFELIAAYLQYNMGPKDWIRFGRQFMALGLEDWIYPLDLASIEFSAHNFEFAIWNSFGVQWRHTFNDRWRIYASAGNGAYGGRQEFPAPKASDLGLIGRVEWNILGGSRSRWDDMVGRPDRHSFGMLLGASVGHQIRRNAEALKTDSKNGTQFNIDFSMQGNRYHFYSHYSRTWLTFQPGVQQNFWRDGFYGTFTYWLSKEWMPYARFDYVGAGNKPGNFLNYAAPGLGISYYPFFYNNKNRISLEYNFLKNPLSQTTVAPDGQLGFVPSVWGAQSSLRLQVQFGF
jgi:hypothetical protein